MFLGTKESRVTLRLLDFSIDNISKNNNEYFRQNFQPQIPIYLEKSQRHSALLCTQKHYILLDFYQIL